jgi:hypothetical protein
MAGDYIESGGAGRLLMAMPPRPAKKWTELEIDPDAERQYHELLDSLYRLGFDGEGEPNVLKLSSEAKAAWVAWYDDWAREQASVEGELAAAFSKLEEAAARFALVHHVVKHAGQGRSDLCQVEVESVEAGVKLARWFAQESRRIYAVLAESPDQRDIRQLVDFIRTRGGKMRVRDLQRANGRKYPDSMTAETALDSLAQAGLGRWLEPGRLLELCPTPDSPTLDPHPAAPDSIPPSDTLSDSNGQPHVFPEENGMVSDMSDCRTGTGGTLPGVEGKSGIAGQKEEVSDTDASNDGPYRERY